MQLVTQTCVVRCDGEQTRVPEVRLLRGAVEGGDQNGLPAPALAEDCDVLLKRLGLELHARTVVRSTHTTAGPTGPERSGSRCPDCTRRQPHGSQTFHGGLTHERSATPCSLIAPRRRVVALVATEPHRARTAGAEFAGRRGCPPERAPRRDPSISDDGVRCSAETHRLPGRRLGPAFVDKSAGCVRRGLSDG